MTEIDVNVSKKYKVIIANGLFEKSGELIKRIASPSTAAIVTDDIVDGLYSERVTAGLEKSGISVVKFVIPHGESSKNAESYIKLLNFLASEHLTKTDLLIALGGGVVGDLCGFAAATYLRGIGFVQMPTTLLAMVDSSVGGKVAIDLDAGKNLAGAFYQPNLVICDMDALDTLPKGIFVSGSAEIIKYALIGNEALFEHLSDRGLDFDREFVIKECVAQKRDVVTQDEFDNGARQILNFGHTIGHAVEKLSSYQTDHGTAVAFGMRAIARCWKNAGMCNAEALKRIEGLTEQFGLNADFKYSADEIFDVTESDKKVRGDNITIVVPDDRNKCVLKKMRLEKFKEIIKKGI